MNGYTNLDFNTGSTVGDPQSGGNGTLYDLAEVRDSVLAMVTSGMTNLTDKSSRDQYIFLKGQLGMDKARKIVDDVILFNQRKELVGKKPEDRAALFLDQGKKDNMLAGLYKDIKGFGYGIREGTLTSHERTVMEATGRVEKSLQNRPNTQTTDKVDKAFSAIK